jgi:hypothetical protein
MFRHSMIKRALLAGLVICAASSPAVAQARFNLNPSPGASVSKPVQVASAPARPQPRARTQSGFQWGDAGIGAAGILVLLSVGAAGASAVRRRRVHRVITG